MQVRIRECEPEHLPQVHRLVHDVYVAQGYCEPQPGRVLNHYPWLDNIPETTVLWARHGAEPVATVSLTQDKPWGLHVDEDFPDEMREIRSRIAGPISASWRIAVDREKCPSGNVVIRMMKMVADRIEDGETLVIDCHPQHEKFYRRFWGFQQIARRSHVASVNGAPAVLLLATGADLRRAWESRGERMMRRAGT